jgi:tetratricopeptide (TPR) repeat protein
MAKKKQGGDIPEGIESALSKTEHFIEDNQKIILRVVFVVVAIIAIYVGMKRFYFIPRQAEAQSQMFVAEQYFEIDSFNLALYGDGNYSGFLEIIEDYNWTKSGNLSKYYTGISYLRMGMYEDAIEYLEDFKANDKMIAPIAKGAIGDAYVELNDLETGLDYYLKAARMNDNNFTAPLYLMKASLIYEQLEEFAKAEELYLQIQKDFPEYSRNNNIEKYIARVQVSLRES